MRHLTQPNIVSLVLASTVLGACAFSISDRKEHQGPRSEGNSGRGQSFLAAGSNHMSNSFWSTGKDRSREGNRSYPRRIFASRTFDNNKKSMKDYSDNRDRSRSFYDSRNYVEDNSDSYGDTSKPSPRKNDVGNRKNSQWDGYFSETVDSREEDNMDSEHPRDDSWDDEDHKGNTNVRDRPGISKKNVRGHFRNYFPSDRHNAFNRRNPEESSRSGYRRRDGDYDYRYGNDFGEEQIYYYYYDPDVDSLSLGFNSHNPHHLENSQINENMFMYEDEDSTNNGKRSKKKLKKLEATKETFAKKVKTDKNDKPISKEEDDKDPQKMARLYSNREQDNIDNPIKDNKNLNPVNQTKNKLHSVGEEMSTEEHVREEEERVEDDKMEKIEDKLTTGMSASQTTSQTALNNKASGLIKEEQNKIEESLQNQVDDYQRVKPDIIAYSNYVAKPDQNETSFSNTSEKQTTSRIQEEEYELHSKTTMSDRTHEIHTIFDGRKNDSGQKAQVHQASKQSNEENVLGITNSSSTTDPKAREDNERQIKETDQSKILLSSTVIEEDKMTTSSSSEKPVSQRQNVETRQEPTSGNTSPIIYNDIKTTAPEITKEKIDYQVISSTTDQKENYAEAKESVNEVAGATTPKMPHVKSVYDENTSLDSKDSESKSAHASEKGNSSVKKRSSDKSDTNTDESNFKFNEIIKDSMQDGTTTTGTITKTTTMMTTIHSIALNVSNLTEANKIDTSEKEENKKPQHTTDTTDIDAKVFVNISNSGQSASSASLIRGNKINETVKVTSVHLPKDAGDTIVETTPDAFPKTSEPNYRETLSTSAVEISKVSVITTDDGKLNKSSKVQNLLLNEEGKEDKGNSEKALLSATKEGENMPEIIAFRSNDIYADNDAVGDKKLTSANVSRPEVPNGPVKRWSVVNWNDKGINSPASKEPVDNSSHQVKVEDGKLSDSPSTRSPNYSIQVNETTSEDIIKSIISESPDTQNTNLSSINNTAKDKDYTTEKSFFHLNISQPVHLSENSASIIETANKTMQLDEKSTRENNIKNEKSTQDIKSNSMIISFSRFLNTHSKERSGKGGNGSGTESEEMADAASNKSKNSKFIVPKEGNTSEQNYDADNYKKGFANKTGSDDTVPEVKVTDAAVRNESKPRVNKTLSLSAAASATRPDIQQEENKVKSPPNQTIAELPSQTHQGKMDISLQLKENVSQSAFRQSNKSLPEEPTLGIRKDNERVTPTRTSPEQTSSRSNPSSNPNIFEKDTNSSISSTSTSNNTIHNRQPLSKSRLTEKNTTVSLINDAQNFSTAPSNTSDQQISKSVTDVNTNLKVKNITDSRQTDKLETDSVADIHATSSRIQPSDRVSPVKPNFNESDYEEIEIPETSAYMIQDFSLKKSAYVKPGTDDQENTKTQEKTTAAPESKQTNSTTNDCSSSFCQPPPPPLPPRSQAAMSAVLTSHFGPTKERIVPFDLELLDLADNYDNATGIFICTIPGTYVISLYLMSHPGAKVNARVFINNRPVAALWADDAKHAGFYPSSSIQTIVQLGFGDQVYVMLVDAGYGESWVHANYNVFTIFLLYEQMFK